MNSRERIKTIIAGEEADRCGFWMGSPHYDTWPILHEFFGTSEQEELRVKIGDDFRWMFPAEYKHPDGKPMWDMQRKGNELAAEGVFADCENVDEVESIEWPNPDYLDFTGGLDRLKQAAEFYRAGGFWCSFFHEVADFFGMENYFIKMYTHPDVVHAVTSHIVDFYIEANTRFFELAGGELDGFFFGNDFGTQLDLLVSPPSFKEFIFPYFKKLTDLGHGAGYQVILHSCGAISKVIPDLIGLGVDCLHPLQAKAEGMSAEKLSAYKGKIAFMGGIDTQDLLVNGTPDEIKADVERLKSLLGPNLIVSPSHEAVLPNVPPENVEAMARAVA